MKQIILTSIIILQTCFGFSQEEPKEKISEVSFFVLNTLVGARFRQTLWNQDMQVNARVRNREMFEVFLGRMIYLKRNTFAVVSVGFRNSLENRSIDELVRIEVRSQPSWGRIRVNYGLTNFSESGVSASVVHDIMGHFIRAGIASNNEHFGPRFEVFFPLSRKNNQRDLRCQITVLSDGNVSAGCRLRLGGSY
ncbi:MAG: hypothetical protein ACJAV6_000169 [Candidatus Paceibacteria bacterium]|jgi:hypothetical protein